MLLHCISKQINAALVRIRDFSKILPTPEQYTVPVDLHI